MRVKERDEDRAAAAAAAAAVVVVVGKKEKAAEEEKKLIRLYWILFPTMECITFTRFSDSTLFPIMFLYTHSCIFLSTCVSLLTKFMREKSFLFRFSKDDSTNSMYTQN